MTHTTRTLTVSLYTPDGQPLPNTDVTIAADITHGLLPAILEAALTNYTTTKTTNNHGQTQFTLIQSQDISPGFKYAARIHDTNHTTPRTVTFHMPSQDAELHEILASTTGDYRTITAPWGPPGEGVPKGGAKGQILAKNSAADYDTDWETIGQDGLETVATRTPATGDGSSADPVTIADAAITNRHLAPQAVTNVEIAPNTIRADNIKDNELDTTVLTATIRNDLQAGSKLRTADNAATQGQILTRGQTPGTYTFANPPDDELGPNTVGTTELEDGSVTEQKLADQAVDTPKLANISVTNAKIAGGAVTEPKISAGNISTRTLANEAVTPDKLNNDVKAAHVPTGGTQGQALIKASNTDRDLEWGNLKQTIGSTANPVWPLSLIHI